LEVKITAIDRKKRGIAVSVRAKETDEEIAAVREYAPESKGGTKLGDLLKEHLDNN
jgi:small subunit ribosomal protein S1